MLELIAGAAIADRHEQQATGFVHRHAPVDAAKFAAPADTALPDEGAIVRIHGVNHARFLAGQQNVGAERGACEYWWGTEIEVRAVGIGTVGAQRSGATGGVPGIVGRELTMPAHAAIADVDGEHRITRVRGRIAVILAGCEVEQAALCIQRRSPATPVRPRVLSHR